MNWSAIITTFAAILIFVWIAFHIIGSAVAIILLRKEIKEEKQKIQSGMQSLKNDG